MSQSPFVGPVADLVDPYFTHEVKKTGTHRSTGSRNAAIYWLRQHPGRWALVGEGTTGLTKDILISLCPDIHVREAGAERNPRTRRTYAQVPHPKGEPLAEALKRRPATVPIAKLYLPELTKDEFNWTKEELMDACRVARANLFPTGDDN